MMLLLLYELFILKEPIMPEKCKKEKKSCGIPSILSCEMEMDQAQRLKMVEAARIKEKNVMKDMKMAILKSIDHKYFEELSSPHRSELHFK
jgi:hypothetical protein